jgi:protocatechuate 3,4-dioxygenase beta subunit
MLKRRFVLFGLIGLLAAGLGLGCFLLMMQDSISPGEPGRPDQGVARREHPDSSVRDSKTGAARPTGISGTSSDDGKDSEDAPAKEQGSRTGPNQQPIDSKTDANEQGASEFEEVTGEGEDRPAQSGKDDREVELTVKISGRVIDEALQGIAGAEVRAWYTFRTPDGKEAAPTYYARPAAVSGEDGRYSTVMKARVSVGTSTFDAFLSASATGFATEGSVEVRGLKEGDVRTGIDIKMLAAGAVIGRVLDQSGNAIAGVRVYGKLHRAGYPEPMQSDVVRTNQDGQYRIPGMLSGGWSIYASSADHGIPSPVAVTVIPGAEVAAPDLVLSPATTIRLKLLKPDASPLTKEPNGKAPRVIAAVRPHRIAHILYPDADGTIVVPRVPADAVELTIEVAGYEPHSLSLPRLIEGHQNDLADVTLRAAQNSREAELSVARK